MKTKLIILMLISAMMFAGCSTSSTETSGQTGEDAGKTAVVETKDESKKDFDSFSVELLDAEFTKDYEGKKVIVINANYTNNEDDAQAFLFQSDVSVYQNGVELETAIVMDDSVYDAGLAQKEVKKGVQIKVQSAYVLDDDSPVEVEVGELFSFSKEVATKTYEVK